MLTFIHNLFLLMDFIGIHSWRRNAAPSLQPGGRPRLNRERREFPGDPGKPDDLLVLRDGADVADCVDGRHASPISHRINGAKIVKCARDCWRTARNDGLEESVARDC